MEKVIEKLKKFRVLIIIAVLLIAGGVLWLVLRSADSKEKKPEIKDNDNRKGYLSDTAYPLFITDNGGSLTIELNGSKSSELKWETSANTENTLWIKEEEAESDGRLTSVLTPSMEGYTTVTYTRSGEIMGISYTAAKIDVDVIASKSEGEFTIKVSDVRFTGSDMGAADTETPYLLSKSSVILPNSGDWELVPENADKLPEGLYSISKDFDVDNNVRAINVYFNPDDMLLEDGTLSEEALGSVLILKSESLGIEKRLKCVVDSRREWILVSAEEDENAGE